MRKFFVVSDVHSFYTPMKTALDKAGFEADNPDHFFISCGDLFDRGKESAKALDFVNSLPADRKILIRGNHEDLITACISRQEFLAHDIHNGTDLTAYDLYDKKEDDTPINDTLVLKALKTNEKFNQYMQNLQWYYETPNFIFVHSWIPTLVDTDYSQWLTPDPRYEWNPNWREATEEEWKRAIWCNPFNMASLGFNKTGKTIVFGHWNASYGHSISSVLPMYGDGAVHTPFYGENYIAIDACTVVSGFCNCLVLEDC